jgi:nicotinate-nucleotide adenylyltransferase
MKKIGIMGGTFNPIHYGHLLLAESAYEQFGLDTVWVMPNGQPTYRMISSHVSDADRTAMVQLAIADNPHFTLSFAELDRAGATYTVDTLRLLNKTHSDTDFYFIMGADSLFHFESWKEPEEIVRLCHILAAQRTAQVTSDIESQMDYLMGKYDADIHLLQTPNLDISSHAIRKRVRNGSSIKYLLPDCVAQYIKEHRLYETASEGCL